MDSDYQSLKLYTSTAQLEAASRPLEQGKELKYYDCSCIAPFQGSDREQWVSSPNMDFVPAIPPLEWGRLSFYADGMLGPFELFKWPQIYDDLEPHACAAPGNPALIANTELNGRPTVDSENVLPSFGPDAQVVWAAADSTAFRQLSNADTLQIGFVAQAFLARLKSAADCTKEQAIPLAEKLYPHEGNEVHPPARNGRDARRAFMWDIVLRLQRALSHLEDIPMPPLDVVLWIREVQRLILELQAWVIYHVVVKPRIDEPQFNGRLHVLPLRGVITSKAVIADTMHRIGVPVWWIRSSTSLTTKMRIVKVREWIPSTIAMSQDKDMQHGDHSLPAPAFNESQIIDNSLRGFADHIRRFSLSSRPTLGGISSALPEEA